MKRKQPKKSKKTKTLHVVMVMSSETNLISGRDYGDFAGFVDTTLDKAVSRAVQAKNDWEEDGRRYDVLLAGVLTSRVRPITPAVQYDLEKR